MAKINLDRLCQAFEDCLGWPYKSPGGTGQDCSQTGIDCSGMFVRAYKLQGARIYHGSNTIWRKHLAEKGRLTSASQLERGMAVFKHKDADTAKYSDGQGDFCHIGLVTSVNPLRIVHASTVGMKVKADTTLTSQWAYWGRLKKVGYAAAAPSSSQGVIAAKLPLDEDLTLIEGALPSAAVGSANGLPVKLRAEPSTSCRLYWEVPCGERVDVISEGRDWWRVRWRTHVGYMMCRFLERG